MEEQTTNSNVLSWLGIIQEDMVMQILEDYMIKHRVNDKKDKNSIDKLLWHGILHVFKHASHVK